MNKLFSAGLSLILVTGLIARTQGEEEELPAEAKFTGQLDVRLADGGNLKLAIKQPSFEFVTQFGRLTVPAQDIRLIELAPRVPEEISRLIEEGIANLGSPQFEIREKAAADLEKVGPLGFPQLVRFAKANKDLEVAARLSDILDKVRAKLPEDQGEQREWDILHTNFSRIAGRLDLEKLAVESPQFGTVELKLADARELRFQGGFEEIDLSKLENAPAHLYDRGNQIGKTFTWKIKGNAAAGTLWGTDVYTLDSSLAAAAVHAGVVKDGQAGAIRVKIVESPASFTGSTRNGITSHPYRMYQAAFKIIKLR